MKTVTCPGGRNTRIFAGPTFGPTLAVWMVGPSGPYDPTSASLGWTEYNVNPPWSLSGRFTVNNGSYVLVFVGPPSPYVELWVVPSAGVVLAVS